MSDSLIERLTREFQHFPGIGPRQAKRFVYYLLRLDRGALEHLSQSIRQLPSTISQCTECRRFFSINHHKTALCEICADSSRDQTLLMLVEKDIDLENVERSGTFTGYYFVLGGLVPILDKDPERAINANALLALIKRKLKAENSTPKLSEIIIALSANLEGDSTAEFIKKFLSSNLPCFAEASPGKPKITTLGRGLSTGTELEYSDPDTLKNALKHRE